MESFVFPDKLFKNNNGSEPCPDLIFYDYFTQNESVKNKVIFKKNIFNFLIQGRKTIHKLDKAYPISNSQCIIISSGNCLTTEQFSENGRFNSLTLYFDAKFLQDFLMKHTRLINSLKDEIEEQSEGVFVFVKDSFVENYIESVKELVSNYDRVPYEFAHLKTDEILIYLLHKYGAPFLSFLYTCLDDIKETDFRTKMESEALNKYTLEEIAFLCNMSLSTFKRHFRNIFGTSPQKWFQKKRLQYAYDSLEKNTKTSSELFIELGYSCLSNFSNAFSKTYGVSPTKIYEKKSF
jgi:AraC-like DNA-binding protein